MSNRKQRIIVAGSAADPVTLAHQGLAESLACSGLADRILWFPTGDRTDKKLTPSIHRARMSEIAFDKAWRQTLPIPFHLDLRDVHVLNPPTIVRLRTLQAEYPDAAILFAVGADVVTPKETWGGKCDIEGFWDEGEALMSEFCFIVLPREGYPTPDPLQLPKHWIFHHTEGLPVSSTEVRRRVAAEEPYEHLVPPGVAKYIRSHGLYLKDRGV